MDTYQGVETLEVLEGANNYNRWILENFTSYLKEPILEIGAGTGNISKLLLKTYKDVYLSDIDPRLARDLSNKFNLPTKKVFVYDAQNASQKRYKNFFKSIVAINVLEHIENDEKALKNLYNMLKQDGYLLMLVPAKKIAYSELDRKIGHFRRYELTELKTKCKNNGFKVRSVYFFNFLGLISWIARNKVDKGHIKPYQVKIFDMLVPLLKRVEKIKKPFAGVSLIVIAQKS